MIKATYGPEADADLSLFIRLNRSTQAIVRGIQRVLLAHDLSLTQFAVLEALFHKGQLTTGEIMRSVLTTGGNITIVLKNLERKGLITTCEDAKDRRRRTSRLTDTGEQVVIHAFPDQLAVIREKLAVLTDEEKRTVTELLLRIEQMEQEEK